MQFLKLTDQDGTAIWVSPAQISYMRRANANVTDVYLSGGYEVHVKEPPELIQQRMDSGRG